MFEADEELVLLLAPPWTAEDHNLADAEAKLLPELELDLDPRLDLSEVEDIVSVDVDCLSFRFCNNLLVLFEARGINLNPSLVALWNAS